MVQEITVRTGVSTGKQARYAPLNGFAAAAIAGLLLFLIRDVVMLSGVMVWNSWFPAVQQVIFVATGISFILWMTIAQRNLTALGARGLKHKDSEVWWSFIVPIIALYKPAVILSETWKASAPVAGGTKWKEQAGAPVLVIAWFAFWLCTCLGDKVANQVGKMYHAAVTDSAQAASLHSIYVCARNVDLVLNITAALLAISLVWIITSRQAIRSGMNARL